MNLVNFLSIYGLSMRSRELTLDAFCGARPSVFQASCQESTNREVALRPSSPPSKHSFLERLGERGLRNPLTLIERTLHVIRIDMTGMIT
jgi:hypothetical protein